LLLCYAPLAQPHHHLNYASLLAFTAWTSFVHVLQVDIQEGELTPHPWKVHLGMQDANLDIALHPPTPSTANSNFTRLVKGLVHEMEAEQSGWHAPLEVKVVYIDKK
jgi:hypothetical protein